MFRKATENTGVSQAFSDYPLKTEVQSGYLLFLPIGRGTTASISNPFSLITGCPQEGPCRTKSLEFFCRELLFHGWRTHKPSKGSSPVSSDWFQGTTLIPAGPPGSRAQKLHQRSGEGLTFIPTVSLFVQTLSKSFVDTDFLISGTEC